MAKKKASEADPRRQLKRAACLLQGFRDALTPEAAAQLEPIGKLLEPAVEAVEWGCPRPPDGELTSEQRASLKYTTETVSALLAISKTNADHYAPADVVLTEIAGVVRGGGLKLDQPTQG